MWYLNPIQELRCISMILYQYKIRQDGWSYDTTHFLRVSLEVAVQLEELIFERYPNSEIKLIKIIKID